MKQIPDFCSIMNPVAWGTALVLDTRNLLVGLPYCVDYREKETIERFLSDMANERQPLAKVPGHTIFMIPKFRLVPGRLSREETVESLRGMADYFANAVIAQGPAKYARNRDNYAPDADSSWRPLTPEQLAEKRAFRAAKRAARKATEGRDDE